MNMVEKVARAICSASGDDWDQSVFYIIDAKDTPETAQEVYRDQARAAIEAMREPTMAMVLAGMKEQDCGTPVNSGWQAMIDAALKAVE